MGMRFTFEHLKYNVWSELSDDEKISFMTLEKETIFSTSKYMLKDGNFMFKEGNAWYYVIQNDNKYRFEEFKTRRPEINNPDGSVAAVFGHRHDGIVFERCLFVENIAEQIFKE